MENITAYINDEVLRDLEPNEYANAIRDIAGFYEVQSHCGVFYGDANFGTTLDLPYWDYLDIRHLNISDIEFLRTGSLLILAAMALEPYEDLGNYFLKDKEKSDSFKKALIAFKPTNTCEQRLKNLILKLRSSFSLETAEVTIASLEKDLQWVYVYYIYGYFRNRTKSFDDHLEILYKKVQEC